MLLKLEWQEECFNIICHFLTSWFKLKTGLYLNTLTWAIPHFLSGYRGRPSWISCLIWLWSLNSMLCTNCTLQGTEGNGSQSSMVILSNSWRHFLTVECYFILYTLLELDSYDILILFILIAGHNSSKACHTIFQYPLNLVWPCDS